MIAGMLQDAGFLNNFICRLTAILVSARTYDRYYHKHDFMTILGIIYGSSEQLIPHNTCPAKGNISTIKTTTLSDLQHKVLQAQIIMQKILLIQIFYSIHSLRINTCRREQ